MNRIMDELNALLKADAYFLDESGEIIREKVKTAALSLDDHLMNILIGNEETRKAFFVEKNGVLIFDKVQFSWLISSSDFLPDSYTAYKNKIGLIDQDRHFLKTSDDVVLSFPYKECVLEFDSTDENEDRDEVFLNETLASTEIDTLLSPKALTAPTLHTSDGTVPVDSFDGQSLVIKGNNLIALWSLLPKFEGQIKLMYWDILYNTNNDQVPYNDSFKHSSWLTMMKNRVSVAWRLLCSNGIIAIQCDKNEDAYLTVLMDEVFGRQNHVATITVKSNSISGNKTAHKEKTILKNKDSILIYSKTPVIAINPQYTVKDKWDTHYNSFLVKNDDGTYTVRKLKEVLIERGIIASNETIKENHINNKAFYDFVIEHRFNIFRGVNSIPPEEKKRSLESPNTVLTYNSENNVEYTLNGARLAFLAASTKVIDGEIKIVQLLGDLWTDIDFQNTQNEGGGVSLPAGKKPEALLRRIIEMLTTENDLILDAYFGSGTTGAVAMKLGRRFIGIEQLDSHYKKAIDRLTNVINGEQGGISTGVNWQGGGSFVSCELAKDNHRYIDLIPTLDDAGAVELFKQLLDNPLVLCHSVNVQKAKENIGLFEGLSLDDKKKVLISIIEKNTLYVSYTDIDDEEKGLSDEAKRFSRSFYGE